TGGGGKGAGAVPGGADDDADRSELVLGLYDGEFVLLALRVDPQPAAMASESFGQRRRWRDRIPGAYRGAAIDRAEGGRRIAFDEDAVADAGRALQTQADRVLHIHHHPIAAEVERVFVGVEQLFLAFVLLGNQLFDFGDVHVEQRGQCADIDDVLEQLALARIGIFSVADRGQRDTDH